MILPGSIQDGAFNTLGYEALEAIKAEGFETSFSEQVATADVERVARELVGTGYNVLFLHGGEYFTAVKNLAVEFPDVTFVTTTGGKVDDLPANIWNVGRKYYQGGYAMGVMAARLTQTKKVGWVGGIELPPFLAELNAFCQAVEATDPEIETVYTFNGNMDDQVLARQSTETMINDGVDFFITGFDSAIFGVIEAVKAADNPVYFTASQSTYAENAPENFATALVLKYAEVYPVIVKSVEGGELGGYFEMTTGKGMFLDTKENISAEIIQEANDVIEKINKGEIVPVENQEEVVDCG